MVFLLRTDEGGISAVSGGTLVDPEGKTRAIRKDEFAVTILDTWKSPHSEAVYPSRWQLADFSIFSGYNHFTQPGRSGNADFGEHRCNLLGRKCFDWGDEGRKPDQRSGLRGTYRLR